MAPATADAGGEAAPVIVVTPAAVGVDPYPTTAAIAVGLHDETLQPVLVSPVRVGRPQARRLGDRVGAMAALPGSDEEHPASRLSGGMATVEAVRLFTLGPPVVAARAEGQRLPPVAVQAALISRTARRPDVDLVLLADGAGMFTPIDEDGATTADLLDLVAALEVRVGVVVVSGVDDGAVHATTALVEALRARRADLLGVVLAARPEAGDEVGGYVAGALEAATGVPLLGSIPAGAGDWDVAQFTDRAGAWLPIR